MRADVAPIPETSIQRRNHEGHFTPPFPSVYIGWAPATNRLVGCVDVGGDANEVRRPIVYIPKHGM